MQAGTRRGVRGGLARSVALQRVRAERPLGLSPRSTPSPTTTPRPHLVNLAQAMAGGRFDYDIVGYTVASQQVAAVDEQADAGAGANVGVVDTCFDCYGMSSGVYLRLWLLQQHLWPLRPLLLLAVLQLRPVLPGVGLWPNLWLGLGLGGLLRLLLQRQRLSGRYYPPYPYGGTVHALPEEVVGSHLEWLGAAVPSAGRERLHRDEYRLRSAAGDRRTAARALPRSDLGEHCGWRGGRHVGGKAGTAPVSKTTSGSSTSGSSATGGRRREAAPAISSGGSSSGKAAPTAVPSRPRSASQASPSVTGGTSGRQAHPSTSNLDRGCAIGHAFVGRPALSDAGRMDQAVAVGLAISRSDAAGFTSSAVRDVRGPYGHQGDRRGPELRAGAEAPGVGPAGDRYRAGSGGATGQQRPVRAGTPDRGYSPPPPSQPSPGYSGGGSYGGVGWPDVPHHSHLHRRRRWRGGGRRH